MNKTISVFFYTLNSVGIDYCHWKSNSALDRTFDGLNDIDLLVKREQYFLIQQTIFSLGFKRVLAPWFKNYTAVENFIANTKNGALIHLHLHYQLILGEKNIKGYHLPYETELINRSTVCHRGAKIPKKEDELVILVSRIFLKFGFVSILKKIFGMEKTYFPRHIIDEFSYLQKELNDWEVEKVRKQVLPSLGIQVIYNCVNSLDKFSLLQIHKAKKQIKKDFRLYNRYSKSLALTKSYLIALIRRVLVLGVCAPNLKKVPETGGIAIALMGIDGAGKSTVIKELYSWLKPHFKVSSVYLGSGDGKKTLILSLFNHLIDIIRGDREEKKNSNKKGKQGFVIILIKSIRVYLQVLHKRKTLNKSVKKRNQGYVIIYDRFPQKYYRGINDGPKSIKSKMFISRNIYNWEVEQYELFDKQKPDLMLYLQIPATLSVSRKSENEIERMIEKKKILDELFNNEGDNKIVIDASLPLEDVLLKVKSAIWQRI